MQGEFAPPKTIMPALTAVGQSAKRVGQVITRQDHRDFTSGEAVRVMTRLGLT